MKIIAKTQDGYIAEIDPTEIRRITGSYDDSSYRNDKFRPGDVLKVSDTYDHLAALLQNEKERKKIAESLRAAATLIEHTPSPLSIPETTTPGEI